MKYEATTIPYHEIFEKRTLKDFSKKVQQTANFMSISRKINLVGSASLKEIKYYNDFDLNEQFESKLDHPNHILKLFQDKYEEAKKNNSTFIIDFKCGMDKHTKESLKWQFKDIMNGYILDSRNNKIYFVDAMFEKSIMKLDVVEVLENNLFGEFSDVYLIKIGKKSNFHNETQTAQYIKKELLKDAKEFQKDNNNFKALKRLFSYDALIGKNKHKQLSLLLNFFNSYVGFLYKITNNLNVIELVEKNTFKKAPKDIIKLNINHNIELLKSNNFYVKSNNIKTIIKKLEDVVNGLSIKFTKENNIMI